MFIVVIDDDESYLTSIKTYCERLKIDLPFMFFQDAFEAMEFISKNSSLIRVVFTDFNMKSFGMSGKIIVQKCIENAVNVVVCTGYDKSSINLHIPVISKVNVEELIRTAQKY